MSNSARTVPSTETEIDCINCSAKVAGFPSVDHHPRFCQNCGAEMFLFSIQNRNILIDVQRASDDMKLFIRWAQRHLGEADFMEFMLELEEVICPQISGKPQ